MPGPSNPALAPLRPIPPPVIQLPWGELRSGHVWLNQTSLEFLQLLWAMIQGQGGVLDQILLALDISGVVTGLASGLIEQDDRAALFPAPLATARTPPEGFAPPPAPPPQAGGDLAPALAYVLAQLAALGAEVDAVAAAAIRPPVPGFIVNVQDEGVQINSAPVVTINFAGAGVTATETSPGVILVTIP